MWWRWFWHIKCCQDVYLTTAINRVFFGFDFDNTKLASISAELRGLTATRRLLNACFAKSMLRWWSKAWSLSAIWRPGSSKAPSLKSGIAPTDSAIFSGAPFRIAKCVASSGNRKDVLNSSKVAVLKVRSNFGIPWMLAAIFLTLLKGTSKESWRG